jgi:hypothetical protein
MKAVFECPWGCAEVSRTESGGLAGSFFHENAWECPKFSQQFLEAVQAIVQKLEKTSSEAGTQHRNILSVTPNRA